jgi:hypothetical protein
MRADETDACLAAAQFRGLLGTRGQSALKLSAYIESRRAAKPRVCSSFPKMELAGLEPATSWVRSRRSPN